MQVRTKYYFAPSILSPARTPFDAIPDLLTLADLSCPFIPPREPLFISSRLASSFSPPFSGSGLVLSNHGLPIHPRLP